VSADGLIVTCSHVIQDEEAQQRGDLRPEMIRIVFVATGEGREARVDAEYWLSREEGDIAILQLVDALPDSTSLLPLGPAANTAGHRFWTHGFRGENERAGGGDILGLVPVGTDQWALQLRSQEVTQGYSGAPVWDEQMERVVGMVSHIARPDEHGRHRDTAFATPSETLRTACPVLEFADAGPVLAKLPGSTTLDLAWLKAFHAQQAAIAGEKYRPDLHVDLPISRDLAGLGLSQSTAEEFKQLRKQLGKVIRHIGSGEFSDSEIGQAWQEIVEAVNAITLPLGVDDSFSNALKRFDALEGALKHLVPLVQSLEFTCFRKRDALDEGGSVAGCDGKARELLNGLIYDCQSIRRPASALLDWLQESSARAARCRFYFLTGSAGTGKTHLFLDSVHDALSENRPAIVLHGAQFGGELWTSICSQLSLDPLARDVLLGAMDAAAVGLRGDRFVIMVDAINETPLEGFWEWNLPVLRAAIARWPNLALAVSCRDTYVEVVDPENDRDRFVVVNHPGFAGREIEATDQYFSHYGLEAPRIPLLVPEFTVPLFLRLYCESLVDSGSAAVAVGHEGRIEIFERYLQSKIKRVARSVFTSVGSNLEVQENRRRIRRSLEALLDRMAGANAEWISLDDAVAAVANVTGVSGKQALAIISAFENEGVLSQEPSYLLERGSGIAVRVLFQAFSDFLLLKRRLDQYSDPPHDETLKAWLRDTAGWGILEAATVVFPERYGMELPDFLGLDENLLNRGRDPSNDWAHVNRVRHVFKSLVDMLPYRSAEAVTQRSVQVLNVVLQSKHVSFDLFNLLYTIAPQPNNPLNSAGLHNYLARQTMPNRDASFGFAVYHSLSEETTSVTRLARWAAQGPYPSYNDEVIELSATALAWLLSSANRRMRDWVTKALVHLLHGHLDVMNTLLNRFWNVNDPYVVQRVMLVAYGCLMRGGQDDQASAKLLVENVLEKFTGQQLRRDELLLDAGKGAIEWGISQNLVPTDVRTSLARPHSFPTLGHPLSMKRIKAKYETSYKAPRDATYSTIFNSIENIGDFGRYVIDSSLYRFTHLRPGTPPPPEPLSEWCLDERAVRRFEKSLTPEQAQRLNEYLATAKNPDLTNLLYPEDQYLPVTFSDEQVRLLGAIWVRPAPAADISFPTDVARRWLFLRTISLGWRPELFGNEDYFLGQRDDGRSEHKAERWGKKYQWIAFHELMARVADNYQTRPQDGVERAEWDPYLRLDGLRDLDPSLPPVDFLDFVARNENAISWKDSGLELPDKVAFPISFDSYHGDIDRFINERRREPLTHLAAKRRDKNGQEWIALHSYEGMKESSSDPQEWGMAQTVWLHSWFISGEDADQQSSKLVRKLLNDSWHLNTPSSERGAYWGELSWMKRAESGMTAGWRAIDYDPIEPVNIIDTCEDYLWEGNGLDCSIEESVFAYVPSRFILERLPLIPAHERPAWKEPGGRVVFMNTRGPHEEYPQARTFWVLKDWIQTFLQREKLALVVATEIERLSHLLVRTSDDSREMTLSVAILTADGQFRQVGSPFRSPWPVDDSSWVKDE
jgi:hypothetical protein